MHADHLGGIANLRWRDEDAQRLHFLGPHETRLHVPQRLERADHQPGADQQQQRQTHLRHNQRAPDVVPLPALALRASSGVQRQRDVRTGVLDHRNGAEQRACQHRYRQRKQQHGPIDRNLVQPRKIGRRKHGQKPHRAVSQSQPCYAAQGPKENAFGNQSARDLSPTRAQRDPDRQFVQPAFGPHQEQVRHISAGDYQHDSDGPHQHP